MPPAVATKDLMKKEILLCAQDPAYFMKNYAKISHPVKGKIPFHLYPFQEECVKHFLDHRFNIILKSRQLGLSTVTAAFSVWFAMFNRDKNILVIATKLDVAMNFIKKVRTVVDNLPDWFKFVKITGESKKSITLSNGSTITAVPTSEDAGRSEALSLLIVDEAAIIKNFEEVWTGLYPTISTGGRAILLSTPKGAAGQFYDIWVGTKQGENDFNPITLPWWVHPEHDEAWFKTETKGFSPRKVAQEFLCDFNASGDTFLQEDDMEWLRKQTKDPIDKWAHDGNMWVWERPMIGETYTLSGDVSRGNAEDYSTFYIFKDSTNEAVAEYKGKMPPDQFGKLMFDMGTKYNNALICPENNTFGHAACRMLQVLEYANLFYEGRRPGHVGTHGEVPGFSTQKGSRDKILANLEKAIRNRTLRIYSERLLLEMKTFVWDGNKARAQNGKHDDLVMALAIGAWLLDPTAAGDGGGDYAQAFLAGMSVESRQTPTLPGAGEVYPVMTPTMASPVPRQSVPGTAPSDPRGEYWWLLR